MGGLTLIANPLPPQSNSSLKLDGTLVRHKVLKHILDEPYLATAERYVQMLFR